MKKIAVLAMLAGASAIVHAQSNLTLFGVVDASVRYVKNGDDNVKSLSSNGANSSRLGVRGIEDLGGGLNAGFWLEHGFNLDTGSQSDSTRFWNRRSTVSLMGSFGEVRLGRDKTPTYNGFADYDAFGTNGVAAADKFLTRLGTNVDTNTRADNMASYFLPGNLNGVYGQFSVAPGEGIDGKKYYGGRVGYAAGPLDVSASYGQTEVTPLVGGDDKFKFAALGASYDFGVVKVTGSVWQAKYVDQKQLAINVGALVPVSSSGAIRVSYSDIDASGHTGTGASIENDDASQFAIGYLHNMSKRTTLYTTVARVNNKGAAAFAVDSKPAISGGQDSTGFEVGISHKF
jgi:predicted porin